MAKWSDYYCGLQLTEDLPFTDFCKLIAEKKLIGFKIIVDPLCDGNEMLTDEQVFLQIRQITIFGDRANILIQTFEKLPDGFLPGICSTELDSTTGKISCLVGMIDPNMAMPEPDEA